MKFKLGDKVEFLNEKGGGIISRIVDVNVVHVTVEDGFDLPVMATNLIKVGTAETANDIEKAYRKITQTQDDYEPEDENIIPLFLSQNNPEQRPDGLYFAMIPEIQENPGSGSLDVFLINNTQYELLFSLFLNYEGSYHGTEFGFVSAHSGMHLAKIGRSEIEKWSNALVQTVFFKDEKCTPLSPFSGLIKFRPVKLYKEESYQYESLTRNKGFWVEIATQAHIAAKSLFEEQGSQEQALLMKQKSTEAQSQNIQPTPKAKPSFLDKHKIDDAIAEVDLHIGELVDNFTNLEKNDLLQIQLDYFKKCLLQADKERLGKIIFIHGVGEGKLKTEITRHLQSQKGIHFYDASYARYGMGATEVSFYRNKR